MSTPSARVALPGLVSPSAGFEAPFEMLEACHERLQRTLGLLQRLQDHVRAQGGDRDARQAALDVLRYFDKAAPLHHEDEERHLFPMLLEDGASSASVQGLVRQLQRDHRAMAGEWHAARPVLEALSEGRLERFTEAQEALFARFAARHARHLRDEERIAYPHARQRMDSQQQRQMGAEMAARRGASMHHHRVLG